MSPLIKTQEFWRTVLLNARTADGEPLLKYYEEECRAEQANKIAEVISKVLNTEAISKELTK